MENIFSFSGFSNRSAGMSTLIAKTIVDGSPFLCIVAVLPYLLSVKVVLAHLTVAANASNISTL